MYLIRYDAWVRISAVPRVNVRSLATNQGIKGISMGCSQMPYAEAAYVPLRECGRIIPIASSRPTAALCTSSSGNFRRGITGRFIIRRDQLEAAFSSKAR